MGREGDDAKEEMGMEGDLNETYLDLPPALEEQWSIHKSPAAVAGAAV
jgi:hypothetical protein